MQSYNPGSSGPANYHTSRSGYNDYGNQQSAVPQTATTMSYSSQQPTTYASQQQSVAATYEDSQKPVSYSFGVTAERKEEPLREEKMYSEDDEWQPSAMMLCLLCWIVLVVAGGVGVGIFFANDRRGKNRPSIGPTMTPSVMPSSSPSTVPPNMICNICGDDDGAVITNLFAVVAIPSLNGDFTCRSLNSRGQQGNIPNDICEEEVQQPAVQDRCGCMVPPTAAPTNTSQPSAEDFSTPAPNFVCPICGGEDFGISNPNGIVEFPVSGEVVTCQEIQDRAELGQIGPNVCFDGTLTSAVQLNCNCIFQCNLCGTSGEEGAVGTITNPDGIVQLPLQQGERTCASLLAVANAGDISEQQCSLLQPFVLEPCECVFSSNVL